MKYTGERSEVYSPKSKDGCYREIVDWRFPNTKKEGKGREGKRMGRRVGEGEGMKKREKVN